MADKIKYLEAVIKSQVVRPQLKERARAALALIEFELAIQEMTKH